MKKIVVLLSILLLILCLSGCSVTKVSKSGFYLDTAVTITLYDDELHLETAFEEIERLEKLLSITEPESDVSRVNENDGWIDISTEMHDVVTKALEYSLLTDGAFDITIQPLTALWNVNDGGPVPMEDEIRSKMALVDHTKLKLEDSKIFTDEAVEINLGGVAKGYIADKVCELLKSEGVQHGIVNLGGNVAVFGGKPDGSEYTIGIRDPFGDETDIVGSVRIRDGSVVTSGGYERFFVENGKTYHHIIDPNTGYPAESGLSGVTIISKSSAEADALSTAVYVLGQEKGIELIESLEGVECLLITDNGELVFSSGMSEYFIAY